MPEPMLEPDTVEVWGTYYRRIDDERLLARYRLLLSDRERAQQQRFHFADDRRRYLVTRAAVRTLLSRRFEPAVEPQQWAFGVGAHGRPVIMDHPRAAAITFNVSHTGGLILIALAHERPLGVDVEHLDERPSLQRIAERYFAPHEAAALRALPAAERVQAFYEYWTRKESYLKALGVGLAASLSVDLGRCEVSRGWHFWQLRLRPYVGAVCAGGAGRSAPRLLLKETVPLVSERPLECEAIRYAS